MVKESRNKAIQFGSIVHAGGSVTVVPSGVWTQATFLATMIDNLNEFNVATEIFTALNAGVYLIIGKVAFQAPVLGMVFGLRIRINGINISDNLRTHSGQLFEHYATQILIHLDAGSTVDLQLYQASGVNKTTLFNPHQSTLYIFKIGDRLNI